MWFTSRANSNSVKHILHIINHALSWLTHIASLCIYDFLCDTDLHVLIQCINDVYAIIKC